MNGVQLIAAERTRQIEDEGWDAQHDDSHSNGQLAAASICYTEQAAMGMPMTRRCNVPRAWPWGHDWWKPADDQVRNLVKAGALIAAEIDRLQRQSQNTKLCSGGPMIQPHSAPTAPPTTAALIRVGPNPA